MNPQQYNTNFGFGSQLTQTGKNLLILYGIIYVVELLCEHWLKLPLVQYLILYPLTSSEFHIWQILTHPFLHNPFAPINFLLICLVIYFFVSPMEYVFGRKRFLTLFYISALGGAIGGLLFHGVLGLSAPFMGMTPSILALIVVFGMINPEATVRLMFVLPIKAKYLSYGTVFITLLTILAKANPQGAYQLGGILFGYLYFKGPRNLFDPQLLYLRFRKWQLDRKKARFKVVKKDSSGDDDKPTYH